MKLLKFFLCFGVIAMTGTLFAGQVPNLADGHEQEKNDGHSNRQTDWKSRPVYLLKVKWPDLKDKEKIIDQKLLPLRLYVRYEPRFFEVDPMTKEKKITGALGVDLTSIKKQFLEEPHRLLGKGSVVPGEWLGDDTPGRMYEFVGGDGPFATQYHPTNRDPKYVFLCFHDDGTVTEKTVYPTAVISDSSKPIPK